MSQGHNTLPQPGLEPKSSDSEPSALTTGLLDKAMALACPRYSWPCMLKVAPCMVIQSYIQIYSAWWVTILYNYEAMLCQLCYNLSIFSLEEVSQLLTEALKRATLWWGKLPKAKEKPAAKMEKPENVLRSKTTNWQTPFKITL